MKYRIWLVYALLLLTTMLWSGNIVIGRAIYDEISPLGLSFWRWAFASLLLLPFVIPNVRRDWAAIRSNWRILVLLAFLGVSLFNSILYYSAHSTLATNIALIQTTLPLFVVILNFVLFRRGVNAGVLLGVGLGLAGAFVVIIKGDFSSRIQFAQGDLFMVVAVLAYAFYSVLLIKAPVIHPNSLLAVTIGLGTLLLLPVFIVDAAISNDFGFRIDLLPTVLYVALFPSIFAYWAWNFGVMTIGASATGLFICFIPIFTAVLAAIFLHEALHLYHLAGLLLVGGGVVLVHKSRSGN